MCLYHFTFPPAVCAHSSFSTSCPTFGIVSLFYFSHFNGYVVVSHHHCGSCEMFAWGLQVEFSLLWWLMMVCIFHTLIGYPYVYFGEVSVLISFLFLKTGLFSHRWIFRVFFCILTVSSLSGVCFTKISSQSVICVFILLKLSCKEQKFSFWWSLIYQIFSFMDCAFGVIAIKSS